MNLDVRQIRKELEYYGNKVTIRVVTDEDYSKWGDATETLADTTEVIAFAQYLTQEDDMVKEGTFQSGDILFWFKSDASNITRGNRIQFNSLWYEINEVVPHYAGDTIFALEARTKKI